MKTELQKARLDRLKREIDTIPNTWTFPAKRKVHGFLGAGPLMFVGERPSTGKGSGPADRVLYDLLEKLSIGDSHLTDVITSRGKVGEPYPEDMGLHKRIFDRELRIVRPHTIIAFGPKVYDLLQFSLAGKGITIRQVYHYAYSRRGADKAARFDKQFREVVQHALAHRKRKNDG